MMKDEQKEKKNETSSVRKTFCSDCAKTSVAEETEARKSYASHAFYAWCHWGPVLKIQHGPGAMTSLRRTRTRKGSAL
jgi:hypothetical protein